MALFQSLYLRTTVLFLSSLFLLTCSNDSKSTTEPIDDQGDYTLEADQIIGENILTWRS